MEQPEPAAAPLSGLLGLLLIIGIIYIIAKLFSRRRKGEDVRIVTPPQDDIKRPPISQQVKSGHEWRDKSEFFRDYYESMVGKRDGWVWFYGIGTPLIFALVAIYEYTTLHESVSKRLLDALVTWDLVSFSMVFLVCIPFFMGKIWARKAMYFLPIGIAIAFNITMDGILIDTAKAQMTGTMIGKSIIGLLIYAAATSLSIPNKAFFRIPCEQAKIERYWGAYSNKYARYAAIVGIFFPLLVAALLIPLTSLEVIEKGSIVAKALATVSFIISSGFVWWLCLKAFKIYAPNDIPPIQGRGYAVFGMVAALAWVVFYLIMIVKSMT